MIRFAYTLRSHGWARAVVGNENAEASLTASYLSDALSDFVDGVQELFANDSAECIWQQEPGEFHWKFRRVGVRCVVAVFWNGEKKPIFSGEDDLLHFSSQVADTLLRLLDEHGEKAYLETWGYPFPHEADRKLRQAITVERKRTDPQ
jgi:hypothetical protein